MSLNKAQLVDIVAQETSLTKVDVEKTIKATVDAISNELANDGSITLIGFGTFSVKEKAARTGKNPRTGDAIEIPAKKVAKFKPGKALAEMVNVKKAAKKKPAKKK